MNQEFNYIQPVWQRAIVSLKSAQYVITIYWHVTTGSFSLFRKQAADVRRHFNLASVFRNVSANYDFYVLLFYVL